MERLRPGHEVDGTYRVDAVLSETDRAHVYVVTHLRFPEVPLVLKVASLARSPDFEQDTTALASLTTPCVARVCDRGRLPDGRLYRVTQRLAGPTLREALDEDPFPDDRAMELLIALAAAAHEAQANALGPCDLSVDNLMFAEGREGRLCLLRALVPNARGPSLEADQAALSTLRHRLERGNTQVGAHEPAAAAWKPPSSLDELRVAMARAGGPRTPMSSSPGASIGSWKIVRRLSETLRATVYDVSGRNGQASVLKVAGPDGDPAAFTKHADLLARVQSRHVVRVVDFGTHEETPYVVMDPLHLPQSLRLQHGGPLAIDAALQTVDELLWGAEAIGKYGGAPSDFSLEHCYQATRDPSPAVLTRAMVQLRTFGVYGRPAGGEHADSWSAAVALYELIAGRLPFPTSKHSLAKAWMGMPIPLASRRADVPPDISDLVQGILTGKRVTTAELRRELTRIRSAPMAMRKSAPPERASVLPHVRGSVPPPDRASSLPQAARGNAPTEPGSGLPPPMTPPLSPFRPPTPSAALRSLAEGTGLPALPFIALEPEGDGRSDADSLLPDRRSIEPPLRPDTARDEPRRDLPATPEWHLGLSESRCPLGSLSVAALSLDGREIVAIGSEAVARYRRGQWMIDPARDTAGRVVSLVPMSHGGYLALTSSGPLLRLEDSGGLAPWGVGLERFTFHGAVEDDRGFTLVGGTSDRKRGVVARLVGETITIVSDGIGTKPLRSATYLADQSLLAVTEDGSILRLEGASVVESIRPCDAALLVTRTIGDEIVAVGVGAWAFRVTLAPLAAYLEAVDTLSALSCVAVDEVYAWAGTTKGRILRRSDRHWRRMNRSFEGDPAVLAIFASPSRVRAVLATGQVVLGQPIRE
jgi:hypothetical protein